LLRVEDALPGLKAISKTVKHLYFQGWLKFFNLNYYYSAVDGVTQPTELCPMVLEQGYRSAVISVCCGLISLDGRRLRHHERGESLALKWPDLEGFVQREREKCAMLESIKGSRWISQNELDLTLKDCYNEDRVNMELGSLMDNLQRELGRLRHEIQLEN
jgi:hypothetical protein